MSAGPSLALEHVFTLTVGGQVLGGFTECSGLNAEYHTYPYEEGGNNLYVHQLRGRLKHENLVLSGGVTSQTLLLDWLMGTGPLAGRQPIIVSFRHPDGTALRDFKFAGAVPVRWTGPSANAGANAVATEQLEIAHQGMIA
ncbi:MAG TPA: phage tail protein [Solirubrobacteraceae bacterium]|nr:phage tail protein [Solirubrobacteraceae bacterium]